MIILPVLLIGGIFAYYKYFLAPLNEKEKAIATDLEKIKRDYNEAVGKTARLSQLQQEISLLNQDIAEVQKRLPPKKDVPYLIRLLSKKMGQFQIIWNRISPGTQTEKEYYVEHSYTIPFKTTFHDLARFLTEIGQMERIFATRFPTLKSEPNAASEGVLVSGELTFLIYTSKS